MAICFLLLPQEALCWSPKGLPHTSDSQTCANLFTRSAGAVIFFSLFLNAPVQSFVRAELVLRVPTKLLNRSLKFTSLILSFVCKYPV